MFKYFLILTLSLFLIGCEYKIKNLIKSDINFVTDYHFNTTYKDLYHLTETLYMLNPQYLPKNKSIRDRQISLIQKKTNLLYEELNYKVGLSAIEQAFDENFSGDRIFSLMYGITGMIDTSYNNKFNSHFFHKLDAQKIYDSARNLEYINYQIKRNNHLFNSNHIDTFSIDYLFGSLIRNQDMLSIIISDGDQRLKTKIIQKTASFILIPI